MVQLAPLSRFRHAAHFCLFAWDLAAVHWLWPSNDTKVLRWRSVSVFSFSFMPYSFALQQEMMSWWNWSIWRARTKCGICFSLTCKCSVFHLAKPITSFFYSWAAVSVVRCWPFKSELSVCSNILTFYKWSICMWHSTGHLRGIYEHSICCLLVL